MASYYKKKKKQKTTNAEWILCLNENADMRGKRYMIIVNDVVFTSGSLPLPKYCEERYNTNIFFYIEMAKKVGGDLYVGLHKKASEYPPIELRNNLIFGKTWEEIQQLQHKKAKPTYVSPIVPEGLQLVYSAKRDNNDR